jgi:class 3 adenylate cyclase
VDANDALIRELERMGATADDLAAAAPGELTGLGARLTLLGPGRRLSFADAAAALGVAEEELRVRWRAAGMPEPTGPGGGFREADLAIFLTTAVAADAFGEAGAQTMSRVVSESMARVARAAGSIFRSGTGNEALAADPSGVELLRRNEAVVEMLLPALTTVMERLLRHHLAADIRPTAELVEQAGLETRHLAVGFVDLVGSTVLADQLTLPEAARLFESFESMANDALGRHGVTLVKWIGDAAMFSSRSPHAACAACAELVDAVDDSGGEVPPVRAGIAVGDVACREGDHFGPPVHLAARLLGVAAPGEVVVPAAVAGQLAGWTVEPRGEHRLKGFADGVEVVAVRPPPPP